MVTTPTGLIEILDRDFGLMTGIVQCETKYNLKIMVTSIEDIREQWLVGVSWWVPKDSVLRPIKVTEEDIEKIL